jgi:hypothetical protein
MVAVLTRFPGSTTKTAILRKAGGVSPMETPSVRCQAMASALTTDGDANETPEDWLPTGPPRCAFTKKRT